MLELARINPSRNPAEPFTGITPKVLAVGLARTAEEIEQIQRLRYDVFTEDMGSCFRTPKTVSNMIVSIPSANT